MMKSASYHEAIPIKSASYHEAIPIKSASYHEAIPMKVVKFSMPCSKHIYLLKKNSAEGVLEFIASLEKFIVWVSWQPHKNYTMPPVYEIDNIVEMLGGPPDEMRRVISLACRIPTQYEPEPVVYNDEEKQQIKIYVNTLETEAVNGSMWKACIIYDVITTNS